MSQKRNFNHALSCLVCGETFFPWPGREKTSKVCSIKCLSAHHKSGAPDTETRFLRATKRVGKCLIWMGSINKGGYGQFVLNGKGSTPRRAHRVSFELFNGPIPKGKNICHTCDVRRCVEPTHLFAASQKININDARYKGRLRRRIGSGSLGEGHPKTFLTGADIKYIRLSKLSTKEIGAKFGLHVNSVRGIRARRTWKHV